MKIFGGEIGIPEQHTEIFASGRSSLRRILSCFEQGRKILLPDFLCPIVFDECNRFAASIEFYSVLPEYEVDWQNLPLENFDILYVVHYFGFVTELPSDLPEDLVIIHDCVFLPWIDPVFSSLPNHQIGFTSFRKILPIVEGSLLVSTRALPAFDSDTRFSVNEFSKPKFEGAKHKAHYQASKQKNSESEELYLSLLAQGESLINRGRDIETVSKSYVANISYCMGLSLKGLNDRQHRFTEVQTILEQTKQSPIFPSFYPVKVLNAASVRMKLASQRIYLPHFWPLNDSYLGVGMKQFNNLLFIPLAPEHDIGLFNQLLEVVSEHVC